MTFHSVLMENNFEYSRLSVWDYLANPKTNIVNKTQMKIPMVFSCLMTRSRAPDFDYLIIHESNI